MRLQRSLGKLRKVIIVEEIALAEGEMRDARSHGGACECKRIVSISLGLFSILHGIEIAFAWVKGYYYSISMMQTGKSSGEALRAHTSGPEEGGDGRSQCIHKRWGR